jgi:hypothetical protein
MFPYEISWKSVQCEPSFSIPGRRGGRKDRTKLIVTVRSFANVPKTGIICTLTYGVFTDDASDWGKR